jgi:hypothetical protein
MCLTLTTPTFSQEFKKKNGIPFSNLKIYSLRPELTESFAHFTHIKKKSINKGERKVVLSALVKYWCKVEYIELRMMKVVLIRVIKGKIESNIVLRIEMTQLFWDIFFYKWLNY